MAGAPAGGTDGPSPHVERGPTTPPLSALIWSSGRRRGGILEVSSGNTFNGEGRRGGAKETSAS